MVVEENLAVVHNKLAKFVELKEIRLICVEE
jgi:hypothetical protein